MFFFTKNTLSVTCFFLIALTLFFSSKHSIKKVKFIFPEILEKKEFETITKSFGNSNNFTLVKKKLLNFQAEHSFINAISVTENQSRYVCKVFVNIPIALINNHYCLFSSGKFIKSSFYTDQFLKTIPLVYVKESLCNNSYLPDEIVHFIIAQKSSFLKKYIFTWFNYYTITVTNASCLYAFFLITANTIFDERLLACSQKALSQCVKKNELYLIDCRFSNQIIIKNIKGTEYEKSFGKQLGCSN